MARIAVDARFYGHGRHGGYRTYVEELVSAVARQVGCHDLWLLLSEEQQGPPGVESLVLESGPPLLGVGWREQVRIPRTSRLLKFDLVHHPCNTMPRRAAVPAVVTVHDLFALQGPRKEMGWRQSLIRRYERHGVRHALRSACLMITVSRVSADRIGNAGFPMERLRVIPNGVSPRFFDRRTRADLIAFQRRHGIQPPYLLTIASADPRKNVESVIQAFATVAAYFPDLSLTVLLTSTALKPRLAATAASLGVGPRITFISGLSVAEMPFLYGGAKLTIFLSLEEGFGLPPLESMAAGTPVVCSQNMPFDTQGDAALWVEPTDVVGAGRAILKLLSDTGLRLRTIRSGHHYAKKHSWDEAASQTLRAYEEALYLGSREGDVSCASRW